MTDATSGATDAELVARVLTADREAFAQVYDRYGGKLYDFAYSMLRHPEDAADTVADSFVLFAERLPQLRDPDRLRPWLYAIVRSECLRRLKARKRVSYGDDEQLMAMADDAKTPEEEAETAALRTLVWDAAAGLADRDRALLDLHLRQGLEGAELAEAMGVTAANAYVMVNRLKAQVDRSLGALLIARMGRDDCDELDDLLVDWDGSFSPLIRKRVARHVEKCEICSERRKRILSPWVLLAGVPVFTAPAALRDRVLNDTRLVAYGAPAPVANLAPKGSGGSRRRAAAAAAAAVVLIGGGAALFWPDGDADPSEVAATPTPSLTVPVVTPPTLSPQPSEPTTSAASPSATPTATASASESASAAPGTLTVSTGAVDLGTAASRTFTLRNTGGTAVAFTLDPDRSWIRVAPAGGTVEPGATRTVTVSAARSGLREGVSTGAIGIGWDGGSAAVRVSVRQENDPVVGRPRIPTSPSCSVPVSVQVTDESRITSVTLSWSGPGGTGSTAMTTSGGAWNATAGQFTSAGNVTFAITARDSRGNTATTTRTVFVNPCPG